MVNANQKMQKFSEIQYQNRKTGEYTMAFKATNHSNYPIFISKSRNKNNSYQYTVGNKQRNYKIRYHSTLYDAINDLKHFIENSKRDIMERQLNRLEKQLKEPIGKKLYNLNDF